MTVVCFYCMRRIEPGQGSVRVTLFRWSDTYDERVECFHTDNCFHSFQITGRPHNPVYGVKKTQSQAQSSRKGN